MNTSAKIKVAAVLIFAVVLGVMMYSNHSLKQEAKENNQTIGAQKVIIESQAMVEHAKEDNEVLNKGLVEDFKHEDKQRKEVIAQKNQSLAIAAKEEDLTVLHEKLIGSAWDVFCMNNANAASCKD